MYEIHVVGVITTGKLPEFFERAEKWKKYRKSRKLVIPKILVGISGPMNKIRLVFVYKNLSEYEEEEKKTRNDVTYSKISSSMPFNGIIRYELYSSD